MATAPVLTTPHLGSTPSLAPNDAQNQPSINGAINGVETPTRTLSINEADEDVLMAVKALGDMRNQRISPTSAASYHSPSASPDQASRAYDSSSRREQPNSEYDAQGTPSGMGGMPSSSPGQQQQADFVSRVSSHFPIVNTAIRAYENSKNSSPLVQLGVKMVESSIATLSKPVMDRLPVAQMDGFACRQLDKLEGRSRSYSGSQPTSAGPASDGHARDWEVNTPTSMKAMYSQPGNPSSMSLDTQERLGTYSSETLPPLSPSTTRDIDAPQQQQAQQQQQQSSRAPWQTMLVGAGGLTAAVSEENMRRLQLCLEWLRWATRITDQHIAILRNFLSSLSMPLPHPESTPISPASARILADAQSGVVDAIKKVVGVVSSYTGSALPEPARAAVRKWILELPERWRAATLAQERGLPPPQVVTLMTAEGQLPSYTTAKTMAHKVLALAVESLDMLKAVTGVFMDSLQSAENWLDRFGRSRPLPSSTLSSGTSTPSAHTPYPAYPWQEKPPVPQQQQEYHGSGYYSYPHPQGQEGYGYEKGREMVGR